MDRQVKATGVLFQDITPEEREGIIKRAMKNSDRYRAMRNEGKDEKEMFSCSCSNLENSQYLGSVLDLVIYE
jgi:hypothetical protein